MTLSVMHRVTFVIAASIQFFCSGIAIAGPLPIVAFTDHDSPKTDWLAEANRALTTQLGNDARFKWSSEFVSGDDIHPQTLRQFKERLAKAREMYFNGEFEKCLKTLQSTKRQIEAAMPSPAFQSELRELTRDVLLYAAMAAKETDATLNGTHYVEMVAAHYADLPLNSHEFPPWLRGEVAAAQKKMQPGKKASITVKLPPSCNVEVDGLQTRLVGATIQVSRGTHTFKAVCDNGDESLMSRRLIGEAPAPWEPILVAGFRIQLKRDVLILKPTTDSALKIEDTYPLIKQLMAQLSMEKLLILQIEKHALTAALADNDEGILSTSTVETESPKVPKKENIDTLLGAVLTAPSNFSPLPASPTHPRKWFKRAAPWILLSSGIALAATGFIVGSQYGSPSRQEPLAWALQLTGVTLSATGIVFFVLPDWQTPAERTHYAGRKTGFNAGRNTGIKFGLKTVVHF